MPQRIFYTNPQLTLAVTKERSNSCLNRFKTTGAAVDGCPRHCIESIKS
jgi:hypothetical protein